MKEDTLNFPMLAIEMRDRDADECPNKPCQISITMTSAHGNFRCNGSPCPSVSPGHQVTLTMTQQDMRLVFREGQVTYSPDTHYAGKSAFSLSRSTVQ